MIAEKKAWSIPGGLMILLFLAALAAAIWSLVDAIRTNTGPQAAYSAIAMGLIAVLAKGFVIVNPNEGQVLTLFGKYTGTLKEPGLRWVNPFTARKRVSLRTRNFETAKLKVNDFDGNPIEIAAVVVWQVTETAEAIFQVDNYENFMQVQSESALRNMATSHPYDAHNEGQMSLRSHTTETADQLKKEIQDRLTKAGVTVIEARISHLAYAPEIASAMLQRQQASAIVAARWKIVEGAVGMVENALELLSQKHVVELDAERRAAMVSNLLVVLCSDRHTQPVVNTGTLYT
ncbi:MAG: SPFH domain-containing protein [Candidatus Acidiferrales bacterium]